MKTILASSLFHFVLLMFLIWADQRPQPPHKQTIKVATFFIEEPKKLPVSSAKKSVVHQEIQKSVAQTPERPTPLKAPVQKKTDAKKNSSNEKLANLVQQSLNKLNKSATPSPLLPNSTAKLVQLESEKLDHSIDYEENLITLLQTRLALPENGEIDLSITIKKDGQMKQFAIVRASCAHNRLYVEQELAQLQFPSFPSSMKEREKTFAIKLKSDSP